MRRVLSFGTPENPMAMIAENNFQSAVDYVMRIAIICIS